MFVLLYCNSWLLKIMKYQTSEEYYYAI